MKKILTIAAASLLLAAAANPAFAEGYIGGSLGGAAMEPTVAEDAVNTWNAIVYGPGNDCDTLGCSSSEDTSTGLKFFGGYRFSPYFAVEGFVAYLGQFDSYANDGYGVDAYASAEVDSLGVAAVGMLPVTGRVSLLGKLGFHRWSADGDIDLWDSAAISGAVGSYNETGVDMMGGLGLHIDIGDHAAMRVELEYFAASTDYTDYGVGFFSVGGMYRF